MKPDTQLEIPQAKEALAIRSDPTTGQLLQAVLETGVTADNVLAVKELIALKREEEDRDAERQFNAAFTALQRELPTIVAESEIPNRGKYQRFEHLMRDIAGPMQKNGFSVRFTQDYKEGRITQTCHVSHISGVTRANSFTVRVGGRADSDTQADTKASTTAKRLALGNAFNLVIFQDPDQNEETDAALEGSPITWEQAAFLKDLVKEVGADVKRFLDFAQANSFEEIGSLRYKGLVAELEKRRK